MNLEDQRVLQANIALLEQSRLNLEEVYRSTATFVGAPPIEADVDTLRASLDDLLATQRSHGYSQEFERQVHGFQKRFKAFEKQLQNLRQSFRLWRLANDEGISLFQQNSELMQESMSIFQEYWSIQIKGVQEKVNSAKADLCRLASHIEQAAEREEEEDPAEMFMWFGNADFRAADYQDLAAMLGVGLDQDAFVEALRQRGFSSTGDLDTAYGDRLADKEAFKDYLRADLARRARQGRIQELPNCWRIDFSALGQKVTHIALRSISLALAVAAMWNCPKLSVAAIMGGALYECLNRIDSSWGVLGQSWFFTNWYAELVDALVVRARGDGVADPPVRIRLRARVSSSNE